MYLRYLLILAAAVALATVAIRQVVEPGAMQTAAILVAVVAINIGLSWLLIRRKQQNG